MRDPDLLELLDFYIRTVEKQDEVIAEMGALLKKYATEVSNLRSMIACELSDIDSTSLEHNLEEYSSMIEKI